MELGKIYSEKHKHMTVTQNAIMGKYSFQSSTVVLGTERGVTAFFE
jgi:hypothetical protein